MESAGRVLEALENAGYSEDGRSMYQGVTMEC